MVLGGVDPDVVIGLVVKVFSAVVVDLSLKIRISVAGDKAVVVVVFDGVTGSC